MNGISSVGCKRFGKEGNWTAQRGTSKPYTWHDSRIVALIFLLLRCCVGVRAFWMEASPLLALPAAFPAFFASCFAFARARLCRSRRARAALGFFTFSSLAPEVPHCQKAVCPSTQRTQA